ncbi:hypothetical protein PVK06_011889 [Gossypium arboreum]|uniref:Putative plant transposon protein domain-containing protein n=1 Tax=Gossypium arboreum TaxID=29729 RepID=A0ABR0QAS4_GOSAR|nr:hypothetical protein PVK06_011889 [Gossypium arboreum]
MFCDERLTLNPELVQEFYTNLTSTNATEVFVRRVKVPLNSKSINDFYDLPNYEDDDYSSILINVETDIMQEILRELTIPRFKWTGSRCGSHNCRREKLTPLAKQHEPTDEAKKRETLAEPEPIQPVEIPDLAKPTEPIVE